MERIDPSDRELLNTLVKRAGAKGVLVGAQRGDAVWDWRPLLLHRGVTSIVRCCSPDLSPTVKGDLEQLFRIAARGSGQPAEFLSGSSEGGPWYLRPFMNRTMADLALADQRTGDPSAAWLDRDPVVALRPALRTLRAIHAEGFAHGNIVPQNVGIQDGALYLLDAGVRMAHEDVNPPRRTLRGARGVEFDADLQKFGRIVTSYEGLPCSPSQRSILERMARGEGASLPSWYEIAAEFLPNDAFQQTSPTAGERDGSYRSGKVIAPPRLKPAATPAVLEDGAVASKETSRITFPPINLIPLFRRLSLFPTTVVALVVLLGAYYFLIRSPDVSPGDPTRYASMWSSAQPSLQRQVGEAAARGDLDAQLIITRDIQAGNKPENVRGKIIQRGFDPRWEADLTATDRSQLMTLALSPLLKPDPRSLRSLERLHPAVSLALLADLKPTVSVPALNDLPVTHLTTLSDPIGATLLKYERLVPGSTFGDPHARALAHLLGGGTDPDAFSQYLEWKDSNQSTSPKDLPALLILLPVVLSDPALAEQAFTALSALQGSPITDAARWFLTDDLAGWSKIPKASLLLLIVGQAPREPLSFEQHCDLLQFPIPPTRQRARDRLLQQYSAEADKQTVQFVVANADRFTRLQVISLFTFLSLPRQKAESLVSHWFSGNPDPALVVQLLLARRSLTTSDPVAFGAAQYLKNQPWEPTTEELAQLSTHPEVLIRALVLSKLDPEVPAARAILEAIAKVEPNPKIRSEASLKVSPESEVSSDEDLVSIDE
jgi:hypothetical protein